MTGGFSVLVIVTCTSSVDLIVPSAAISIAEHNKPKMAIPSILMTSNLLCKLDGSKNLAFFGGF
jgi:hypothetical protein